MRTAALALAFALALSACGHTRPRHRTHPVASVAVGVVLLVGVGLLVGLIADCERPGGNCTAQDRDDLR